MSQGTWLSIAVIPILTRGLMYWRHRKVMRESICEDEKDRDTHRSVIIPMGGFSFTALLALAISDAKFNIGLRVPIMFLVISFTAFYFAMNMQSYKHTRRDDLVATAAYDLAMLCLFLAVAHIVLSNVNLGLTRFWAVIALIFWLIDHVIRCRFDWKHLSDRVRLHEDRNVK